MTRHEDYTKESGHTTRDEDYTEQSGHTTRDEDYREQPGRTIRHEDPPGIGRHSWVVNYYEVQVSINVSINF